MLCDTSFVAWSATIARRANAVSHLPESILARIEQSILAISVITLAEARFGFLNANWGAPRVEQEERRLAGFLQIPLDMGIVDEWARLKDMSKRSGWNVGDNDLWIAATASTRGYPLITCDGDHGRIADPAIEVIHLRPPTRDS